MFRMYDSNSHSYTHSILALGIVRKPTVWVFITSQYPGIHDIGPATIDDLENSIGGGGNLCISLTRPLFTSRHHQRCLVHEMQRYLPPRIEFSRSSIPVLWLAAAVGWVAGETSVGYWCEPISWCLPAPHSAQLPRSMPTSAAFNASTPKVVLHFRYQRGYHHHLGVNCVSEHVAA